MSSRTKTRIFFNIVGISVCFGIMLGGYELMFWCLDEGDTMPLKAKIFLAMIFAPWIWNLSNAR